MAEFVNSEGQRVEVTERKVVITRAKWVYFHPQGGGLEQRMLEEEFDAQFKPAPNPDWRMARFSIDGGPEVIGFHKGQRWNGWAMPHFMFEEACRVSKLYGPGYFDPSEDAFWFAGDEVDGERLYYRAAHIADNDQLVQVFPIGAGAWCWDVEEIDV